MKWISVIAAVTVAAALVFHPAETVTHLALGVLLVALALGSVAR